MKKFIPWLLLFLAIVVAAIGWMPKHIAIWNEATLTSPSVEDVKIDGWSYGEWATLRVGRDVVETIDPPYLLVVAISPLDSNCVSVEITDAHFVESEGERQDILPLAKSTMEEVELRIGSRVATPYAAFQFSGIETFVGKESVDLTLRLVDRKKQVREVNVNARLTSRRRIESQNLYWAPLMGI